MVAERLGRFVVASPAASAWELRAPYLPSLADRIVAQLPASPGDWVLVVHSAAGGVAPAIAAALGGKVRGAVFVDAILPHPGQSWLDTTPPALRTAVAGAASEGVAPPWPRWLPSGALARLLPDPALRADFETECQPIPLGYLVEPAQSEPNWPPRACAYLQLSDGYATEAAAAGRHWPVERLDLHHLAMLTEPDMVATAIARLACGMEAES